MKTITTFASHKRIALIAHDARKASWLRWRVYKVKANPALSMN